MAENPRVAELRGIVDSWFTNYGIDYKELTKPGAAGRNVEFLKSKGLNDQQAQALLSAFNVVMDPNASTGVGRTRLDDFEKGGFMEPLRNVGRPFGSQEPQAPTPTGPDPRKQYLDWITKFTQEMGRPAGPGDPIFDSLTRMGAARASMNVGAQGVRVGRGGLGEAAIQQGANAAVMPYQMQRKQLEAQGLGMLDQAQRGWEGLGQNAHLLNQNITRMNNDAMAQAWAQSQNQNQAGGALAGGLVGGLLGGAATIATGGAAAPLIPGLMTGGAQIGAGIAGNSGPSYRPQQYRPYTPNSSWY